MSKKSSITNSSIGFISSTLGIVTSSSVANSVDGLGVACGLKTTSRDGIACRCGLWTTCGGRARIY